MSTQNDLRYCTGLAAAFVRGRMPELGGAAGGAVDDAQVIARGAAAGLRLHKFKRNTELPRVRRVLGALRGIAPRSLLDAVTRGGVGVRGHGARAWRTSPKGAASIRCASRGRRSRRTNGGALHQGRRGAPRRRAVQFVRASFLTSVLDSGTHWLNRPIVPNALAPGADLFGGSP
jgi:hypothetical protein